MHDAVRLAVRDRGRDAESDTARRRLGRGRAAVFADIFISDSRGPPQRGTRAGEGACKQEERGQTDNAHHTDGLASRVSQRAVSLTPPHSHFFRVRNRLEHLLVMTA